MLITVLVELGFIGLGTYAMATLWGWPLALALCALYWAVKVAYSIAVRSS